MKFETKIKLLLPAIYLLLFSITMAQSSPKCCVTSFVTPDNANPVSIIDTVFASGNGYIYGDFNVTAEFDNTEPCSCGCCEYFQEVKGECRFDGNLLVFDFVDSADTSKRIPISKDNYTEDYRDYSGNKVRYGHRSETRSATEKYTSDGTIVDRANGCFYQMGDKPGWKNAQRGHKYKLELNFRGAIVSTCEGGCDNCAQKVWDVKFEKQF